jgi:hypothetical protein
VVLAALAAGCASSAPAPVAHQDMAGPGQPQPDLSMSTTPGADLAVVVDMTAVYDLAMCPSCDDNVACTIDVCKGATAGCDHLLDHSRCPDGQLCTPGGCVDATTTKVCQGCSGDPDCSAGEACTTLPGSDAGTGLCLPLCIGAVGCPKGFSCDNGKSPPRCMPQVAGCCIDSDGDQHGYGVGCLGPDCNDNDPQIYAGKPEVCDGRDNDCNGIVDDGYLCGGPVCAQIGSSGTYQGTPMSQCVRGSCTDVQPAPCGSYTCSPVPTPVPGDACQTGCPSNDATGDNSCISTTYCDGAACSAKLPDGNKCNRSRQCGSGHCQNGYCCENGSSNGDCCANGSDCTNSIFTVAASCDSPLNQCQGHREDPACVNSQCTTQRKDDDTACDSSILLDCSAKSFPNVTCNGTANQAPLVCASSCSTDSGCVAGTWCKAPNCVGELPDGSACDHNAHGDNQCQAGHHCLNGFCCNAASGYCCDVASSCPTSFASGAVCDSPLTSCQGHRVDRACTSSICGSANVADDSACGSSISKSCGNYNPVTCNGGSNQSALSCPTSCSNNSQCTSGNHCYNGACVPWINNGGGCVSSLQCLSGNCVAGICCNTSCNNTACDYCGTGSCQYYSDPYETSACAGYYLGSGAFDTDLWATIQNASDYDDWYFFYATDGNNACFWPFNDYGSINVYLDNIPAGSDYDIYLYRGSCSSLSFLGSSTNYNNAAEHIYFQESCGNDDSAWYYVDVHRYQGYSCSAPYHLTISAHL